MKMKRKDKAFITGRREFLLKAFPAGTLLCLGCSRLFSSPWNGEYEKTLAEKHKFLNESGMSYKDVFQFAYQSGYIPTMKKMAEKVGKDEFLELLKESSSEAAAEMISSMAKNLPKRDLAAFTLTMKNPDPLMKNVLTFEVVEDNEKTYAVKITECLWAKTFREADVADIGYAAICHGDFAMAKAFNQDLQLIRTKTLMQGHDCCNHKWVWEA